MSLHLGFGLQLGAPGPVAPSGPALGPELVVDGAGPFTADAAGFAFLGNFALTKDVTGLSVRLAIDAVATSGSFICRVGGTDNHLTISATGHFTIDITAPGTGVQVYTTGGFTGTFSNVSVREVGP